MARPRGFDPEDALEKATRLFWEKGYGATSMQDLVEAMGINRFSLYETFGDKQALFQKALAHYRRTVTGQMIALLQDTDDGIDAIRAYFRALTELLSSPMGRIGCLVQNSTVELALHDPEIALALQRTNRAVRDNILAALERAAGAGQLAMPERLEDRADYLFAVGQGMLVMAKAGGDAAPVLATGRHIDAELAGWRSQ